MVSLKSRKAQEMMIPKITLEIIIAAIAIILLITIGCRLFSVDDSEKATLKNFEMLGLTIDTLLDNPDKLAFSGITYYLPPGYTLVGFDKEWPTGPSIVHSRVDSSGSLFPPSQCIRSDGDKACLCLYDGNLEEEGNGADGDAHLVTCKVFERDIVFVGSFYKTPEGWSEYGGKERPNIKQDRVYENLELLEDKKEMTKTNYEYLQLYSLKANVHIGSWLPIGDIYIEKYNRSNKIYIYMTRYNDKSRQRYKYFEFGCPELSEEECKEKDYLSDLGRECDTAKDHLPPDYKAQEVKKVICTDVDRDTNCEAVCVIECVEGPIDFPCMCGDKLKDYGICMEGMHYTPDVDCWLLELNDGSCKDYCDTLLVKSDNSLPTLGSTCEGQEKNICGMNPCGFEGGCELIEFRDYDYCKAPDEDS
ncbi:MAG: hypothetical protein ABIE94_04895 [archaeon]